MSNEWQMDYESNSLRKFLKDEMSSGLDSKTRMVLKRSIRKQSIKNIFYGNTTSNYK